MNLRWRSIFALLGLLSLCPILRLAAQSPAPHTFELKDGKFLLDGKPFQILAGEMHYPRIPRERWSYAMRMARAMGLNTVTTYAFWNEHEPERGRYDFSGQNDLAEFLRVAQQEGLYVVLRPGPYVCAEWEFGGYPAWLLKDRSTVVRSLDPKYMQPAAEWFQHLGAVVKPFLFANGGPIIAVQVENEYGSFGKDHAYMEAARKMVMDSGMGGTSAHPTLLYTADGGIQQMDGSIPGLPSGVNFGPGDAAGETKHLRESHPGNPLWVTEYWAGWFDHWGQKHEVTNTAQQVSEYEGLLKQGYSINLYMLWGGTSFGWMNGANIDNGAYHPDVTSYDYDAPLNERGEPREKFFLLRDAITAVTGIQPPPLPAIDPALTYPIAPATGSASLWDNLPQPLRSPRLLTMEEVGQSYGYILYATHLDVAQSGKLVLDGLHDYARIYLDHKLVGALDRRLDQTTLDLPEAIGGRELEILVENSGRVNYNLPLRGESKGILKSVQLAGKDLSNWSIYPMPLLHTERLRYRNAPCTGPCFFRTSLTVSSASRGPLQDSYLKIDTIHKGFVWIEGRPLGRAWNIGPQGALFVPGSWLKNGSNNLFILDLDAMGAPVLETAAHTAWVPVPDLEKKTQLKTN